MFLIPTTPEDNVRGSQFKGSSDNSARLHLKKKKKKKTKYLGV
jgi:hypothetical protein